MDAKAKVVRYDLWPGIGVGGPDHEFVVQDSGEWVKFTDHEAALAEMSEKLAVEQKAANHWFTEANRDHNRLQSLLTGLEALAGEWEKKRRQFTVQGHAKKETYTKCAAQLTTLTNSAKGE